MNQCPNCGAGHRPDSVRCVKCGTIVASAPAPGAAVPPPQVVYVAARTEPLKPVVALLLSLVVSGLGQLYNGQLLKAILFFIAAIAAWPFCMGWAVHIVSAIEAHQTAQKSNRGVTS